MGVLEGEAVTHVEPEAAPGKGFELHRDPRLVKEQEMLSRPYLFAIVRMLEPGQACTSLYGHAELPALAFVKHKIGIKAEVAKFQVIIHRNSFPVQSGQLFFVGHITTEPAITHANP